VCFAVVIEVDQEAEFDVRSGIDGCIFSRLRFFPLSPPGEALTEPRAAYDVEFAVSIDVDREVGEIVDVIAGVVEIAKARCFTHFGPSYQRIRPEMMSSLPSLLTSAMVTLSAAPSRWCVFRRGSRACGWR